MKLPLSPRSRYEELLAKGATADEALALFDGLEVVRLEAMLGRWRGSGFPTGHPLDGLLEACRWYGKEFVDPEHVHPLLFSDSAGRAFKVDPRRIPLGLAARMPRHKAMGWLLSTLRPLLETHRAKARLRMMEYRGKVSATVVYDDLPILDAFRQVDADTLLGAMDWKGEARPFFFALSRGA